MKQIEIYNNGHLIWSGSADSEGDALNSFGRDCDFKTIK